MPLAACAMFALNGCSKPKDPPTAAAPAAQPAGIAWLHSKDEGGVSAAFAQARTENKPLFLYWGAVWCPPCNQVKSTIFTRKDFVDSSRAFVPVYLDGDTPSAQKLGKTYRVSGYPTMILFRPDGSEITRLAGEVDPAKYMQLLNHGLSGGSSAQQALAAALSGKEKLAPALSSADWRLLAYYSWHASEQTLVDAKEVPATLAKLAAACPPEEKEAAARLKLKAVAAAGADKKPAKLDGKAALAQVTGVLAAPALVRANHDVFVWQSDDIAKAVTAPKSKDRAALVEAMSGALDTLAADNSLSTADRVGALGAKVALARLDNDKAPLPDTLLAQLKDAAARADRETTDLNERQSVINTTGYALREAGLMAESDALYKAELARSHSPYYYMSGLASNARKRGDKAVAIDWAQQAWDAAKGPATRLQWGASLLGYLTELAPEDTARIEKTATAIVAEAVATPDAFFARNRSALNRVSTRLLKWNESGKHNAVLAALRAQVASVCAGLPADGDAAADRAACEKLFVAETKKS
jgi:thiol-disulfide isomerase/thioredoxin